MEIRAFNPVARIAGPAASQEIDPPVVDKSPTFRRPDPSRQARTAPDANSLQGMLAQIASRPSQLKRVLKSLGDETAVDLGQLSDDAANHVKTGGSLADYAQRNSLDPASLQLIGTKAAVDRETSDPPLAQLLRRELEQLQDKFGPAISATLNTAAAIQSLQRPAVDKAWLRGMYLTVVSAGVPVMDAFESLLQKFGAGAFEKGALAMLRALSDDMNAPRSSIAPDRLQMLLLSSMVTVRHLLALIHTCRAFLRQPSMIHDTTRLVTAVDGDRPRDQRDSQASGGDEDAEKEQQEAEQTMLRMVKLVLQLIGSSNAVKMVPRFLDEEVISATQVEKAARIRNEFIDVVRGLPPSLWKEPKLKDQLIDLLRRQTMTDASVS
jgi:type III secretion system YopN/LcrE/InvE/MxiC family regulator